MGEVQKMRQHRKESRQLFLFNDILLYGSCGQPDLGVVIRGHMEVSGMSVSMFRDAQSDEYGLTVTSWSDTHVSFICPSKVHAVAWVNDIEVAARDADLATAQATVLRSRRPSEALPSRAEISNRALVYETYHAALTHLKQGSPVLKYNFKDGQQNERFLRVSYSARQLEWGENSSQLTSRLDLDSVQFLQCGPSSPAFTKAKRRAKKLDSWLCFSIGYMAGGKERTLDLQVASDALLQMWILGLQAVLGASSVDLQTLETFVRSCRDYGDYEEPLVIRTRGFGSSASDPLDRPGRRQGKGGQRLDHLCKDLPADVIVNVLKPAAGGGFPTTNTNGSAARASAVGRHSEVALNYHEGPLEQRLARFYAVYAPEKLANIADILASFAGVEEELQAMLREKYGDSCHLGGSSRPEVADEVAEDGRVQQAAQVMMDRAVASLPQRLAEFYARYAPDKVPFADEIAASYAGREGQLQRSLRDKYGEDCSLGGRAEAPAGSRVSAVANTGHDTVALLTQRLAQFYTRYAPDKVPFADEIASSYAGREEQLQRSLRDKYGDCLPRSAAGSADQLRIGPKLQVSESSLLDGDRDWSTHLGG
jgi:hypothetical protein